MKNLREVIISVDYEFMTIEFDQGAMSEDEFIEAVTNYILSNIQIEVR